ncbi:MAG: transcription elongation factor GreA [Candidatus Omnitrophota bacterium]|jgi:transcription elongation factor GreA
MSKGKIFLTREGFDKIMKELEQLKGEKRRRISKDIKEAREKGDLSENAEYDAAKEAQALNEKRISGLENTLANARIIEEKDIKSDKVVLGATVRVRDKATGDEFDYMLVSEEESDFEANKISISSPVGKALMGSRSGDVVEIKVPAGTLEYEIVSIS